MKVHVFSRIVVIFISTLWVIETTAKAETPGKLDPSFNGTGYLPNATGTSVAIQSDGKIVIGGSGMGISRYNADGSLDTTLNGTGKVTTSFGSQSDSGKSVVIQRDGKIVLGGTAYNGSNYDLAVVRYNADGSLDTTFNGTGKVTTSFGNGSVSGASVAIQEDGKIVLASNIYNGSRYDTGIVRYNADGSLDTTFNGTGKVTSLSKGSGFGVGVAIESDGKIVLGGDTYNGSKYDMSVVRYNADGSLDTTFNGTGKVTTSVGSGNAFGRSVAIESDGKIVLGGSASGHMAIVRYNADGSLDQTFNGTGMKFAGDGYSDSGESVCIQSDGKIVLAGDTVYVFYSYPLQFNPDYKSILRFFRFNADGGLDKTLNFTGSVSLDAGASFGSFALSDGVAGLAIQNDGKIVGVGTRGAVRLFGATTPAPMVRVASYPSFTENGVATLIAADVSVIDVDSADFDGGWLSAEITANGKTDDRLSINNQGNGVGQIGVNGNSVFYGGQPIGTFEGGAGASVPLVVHFVGTAATPEVAAALLKNITFQNVGDDPSSSPRTVTFVLNDGDGHSSDPQATTVSVYAINDAPTLNPVTNQTLPVNSGSQTIGLSGIGTGGEAQTLTVTATSSNTALIPTPSITYSSPDATGSLIFTPVANETGSAVITVTVKDNGGTNSGTDTVTRTFTVTVLDAPIVTTGSASGIRGDVATVAGSVNARQADTVVSLQYGVGANLDFSTVPTPSFIVGHSDTAVSATLTGLTPNTTYSYRFVAVNSVGKTFGDTLTFTTLRLVDVPPAISGTAATNVTYSGATVNGTVDAGGTQASVVVQYGIGNLNSTVATVPGQVTANTTSAVSVVLGGLAGNTQYSYRIVATNGGGVTTGPTKTFTTPYAPPRATTLAVTNVTQTSATVSGTINAGTFAATATVQFGRSSFDSFTTAIPSPISPGGDTAVSATISGLLPGTTYMCKVRGASSVATSDGATLTFTTQPGVPAVTTAGASNIKGTSATVTGFVNGQGAAANVIVRYGLIDLDQTVAVAATTPTSGTTMVSAVLTGLLPNNAYFYRFEATNSVGTGLGQIQSLMTTDGLPTVSDTAISNVKSMSAKVSGTVKGGDSAANVVVQYGIGNLSSSVETLPGIVEGGTTVGVNVVLGGLLPHTTYQYRIVATSNIGPRNGPTLSFTTTDLVKQSVSAVSAASITASGATISGMITAGDLDANVTVEYGAGNLDSTMGTTPATVTAGTSRQVNAVLGGLLPHTAYSYRMVATNAAGAVPGQTLTFTTGNHAPESVNDSVLLEGQPVTIDPRSNDSDLDNDALTITGVTQGMSGSVTFSANSVTYTPNPATAHDRFTYTIDDGHGGRATGEVLIGANVAQMAVGPVEGDPVPGEPAGNLYGRFGVPSVGNFAGKIRSADGSEMGAIFGKDGTVLLREGQSAPGIPGALIQKLGEPSGQAVVATLRRGIGGITAGNDGVVYWGLGRESVEAVLRKGDATEGGGSLDTRLISTDGEGESLFVLGSAKSLVSVVKDRSPGPFQLARKGFFLSDQKIVRSVRTLYGTQGTLAEKRWRVGEDAIGAELGVANQMRLSVLKGYGLGMSDGSDEADLATARVVGAPGFGPDGVAFKYLYSGRVSLLRMTKTEAIELAHNGGIAPGTDGPALPGCKFSKLGDPIAGALKRTAFLATIAGSRVTESNQNGIWFSDGGSETLRLLARTGGAAVGGGRWSGFQSLVLPDGVSSGPIFTGRLFGKDTVTKMPSSGMWGMDSSGNLQLLLKTGQMLNVNGTNHAVKSFVALTSAPGSMGAAHGYDDDGHVAAVVTLEDGRQAVVRIAIP